MKIIIYFILALAPTSFLFSNPIALPQAIISELKFVGNNNWTLEIGFQIGEFYSKEKFDSICIASSNGYSRIKLSNIRDSSELFVITSDSLISPLSIKREGDYIKIYSFLSSQYYLSDPLIDSLIFGNYPGSTIDSLQNGYSIVRLNYNLFSKCKNPTIGILNDTTGTCGTIRGHIYDKNNNLLTKGNFILDNSFSFSTDGSFYTRVYSRRIIFAYLDYRYGMGFRNVKIDSLELNVNPDSLYEKDIHILGDYIDGVEETQYGSNDNIEIKNYPNPFNLSTTFQIKIPLFLQNKSTQIIIYNILGKRISVIKIRNSSHAVWNGKDFYGNIVPTGIYYYQLVIENKVTKSGHMVLLK